MKPLFAALTLIFLAGAAQATECVGKDLMATLPQADQDEIRARAQSVPYPDGTLWQASKGDAKISLIGTYHFKHPSHAGTIEKMADHLRQADRLLVEMGPEEEARLKAALVANPALIMDTTGPTLPERLDAKTWAEVSKEMEARGVPAVMASRMRPWYLATLMAISPCAMAQMTTQGELTGGLDAMLMDFAKNYDLPVEALEPWDTVLKLFDDLTPQEEIDMIVYSLPAAQYADDYTATMEAAYTDGNIRQIWEFGRIDAYRNTDLPKAEIDRMLDEAEEVLMVNRNRAWIAPLTAAATAAAADDKAVVAAFGALHLPGEQGVLRLLEKDGWVIERIE